MKKILCILFIIFQFGLFGCHNDLSNSNNINTEENTTNNELININEKNEGLYITNYQLGDSQGSLVHLDEDLNFINKYDINAGIFLKGIKSRNSIYSYGSSQTMSIFNTETSEISKAVRKEGKIKQIHSINDNLWAIDNGYLHDDGKYYSKIINLDSNKEYEFNGFFVSDDTKGSYIYILIQNNDSQYQLLEFNTENGEFTLTLLEDMDTTNPFLLVALDNYILFIEHNKLNMYIVKYENLEVVEEFSQNTVSLSDNEPKFVMNYNIKLDEDNKLVFLIDDFTAKFIKVNIKSGEMEEILSGIGDSYTFIPLPGVNGDYIYISLVKQNDTTKIRKYNWKTGELVKTVDISEYIKTNKQIGSMYFYKN